MHNPTILAFQNKSGDKNITYSYIGKVLKFPEKLVAVVYVEGDEHAARFIVWR